VKRAEEEVKDHMNSLNFFDEEITVSKTIWEKFQKIKRYIRDPYPILQLGRFKYIDKKPGKNLGVLLEAAAQEIQEIQEKVGQKVTVKYNKEQRRAINKERKKEEREKKKRGTNGKGFGGGNKTLKYKLFNILNIKKSKKKQTKKFTRKYKNLS
jgi:hypothetical protein